MIRDDLAKVESLLAAGADPNARWGRQGDRFPLQDATSLESTGRLLLEHGADADARACRPPAYPAISVFPCELERGITPLMYAALDRSERAASVLKASGADPTLRDWAGRTPEDYRRLGAERRPIGIPFRDRD